jgi:hypothetical protein
MALRIYKFNFKGIYLGGEAVVVAGSFEEGLAKVKTIQPFNDEPICENKKGEVIKAEVVYFANGDY